MITWIRKLFASDMTSSPIPKPTLRDLVPEMPMLDRMEARLKAQHKCTKRVVKTRQRLVTAILRGERG